MRKNLAQFKSAMIAALIGLSLVSSKAYADCSATNYTDIVLVNFSVENFNTQTSASQPTSSDAFLEATVAGPSINSGCILTVNSPPPNAATFYTLTNLDGTGYSLSGQNTSFSSLSALEAVFPSGAYTFTFTGAGSGFALNLNESEFLSPPPYVTITNSGGAWSNQANAYAANASQPVTITTNVVPGYSLGTVTITLALSDSGGTPITACNLILSSITNPGVNSASCTIPANTLQSDQVYTGVVTFADVVVQTPPPAPLTIASVHIGYTSQTNFQINAGSNSTTTNKAGVLTDGVLPLLLGN